MDTNKYKQEYIRKKFSSRIASSVDYNPEIASKYVGQKILLEELEKEHKNRLEIIRTSIDSNIPIDMKSKYYENMNKAKQKEEEYFLRIRRWSDPNFSPYIKHQFTTGEAAKVPRKDAKKFLEALSVLEEWDTERNEYLTLRLADESIKDKSKSEDEKEKFRINMTF